MTFNALPNDLRDPSVSTATFGQSLKTQLSLLTLLMSLVLLLDLTLIFMQNRSPLRSLYEAAEDDDFPRLDSDPVGVTGCVAKS